MQRLQSFEVVEKTTFDNGLSIKQQASFTHKGQDCKDDLKLLKDDDTKVKLSLLGLKSSLLWHI